MVCFSGLFRVLERFSVFVGFEAWWLVPLVQLFQRRCKVGRSSSKSLRLLLVRGGGIGRLVYRVCFGCPGDPGILRDLLFLLSMWELRGGIVCICLSSTLCH